MVRRSLWQTYWVLMAGCLALGSAACVSAGEPTAEDQAEPEVIRVLWIVRPGFSHNPYWRVMDPAEITAIHQLLSRVPEVPAPEAAPRLNRFILDPSERLKNTRFPDVAEVFEQGLIMKRTNRGEAWFQDTQGLRQYLLAEAHAHGISISEANDSVASRRSPHGGEPVPLPSAATSGLDESSVIYRDDGTVRHPLEAHAPCFEGDMTNYVINSTAEYHLLRPDRKIGTCGKTELPDVDLSESTLLVKYTQGSCGARFERLVIRDDATKTYMYTITAKTWFPICSGPGRESLNDVLIPKVPDGYRVVFRVSSEEPGGTIKILK